MLGALRGTSARRRLNAGHAEFAERFLRERLEDSAASAPSALKPSLRPRHDRRPPGYERAETIKRRARRVRGETPSRTQEAPASTPSPFEPSLPPRAPRPPPGDERAAPIKHGPRRARGESPSITA